MNGLARHLSSCVARLRRTPRERLAAWIVSLIAIVAPVLIVVWPWWTNRSTFGFHDWDVQTSHRYLSATSITKYGEWPGWDPYACGGFPAWGYVESGTNVVSPFLPFYLWGDIRTAIRIEVLGMTLLGAVGAFAVAGRFTNSLGARAMVVGLFAVNGRWGLQTAAGHTWHLAYAFMPWALWAFERARASGKLAGRDTALLAIFLAMLVYAGGIYPLPHTVLLLAVWAAATCALDRSARPLGILAIGGALSMGLSAPKLFPLLATFDRAPRLIESTETLSVGGFWTLLTSREQSFYDRPAQVTPYGWHEWGMYVSLPGALAMGLAFILTFGKKEAALKLVAALFVILGFGAFAPNAPWTLLHEHLPVFRSQHVPSRFLYTAALLLGILVAMGVGALVERASQRFRNADAVAACCAVLLGCDVALISQKPMAQAMKLNAPANITPASFHFEKVPPYQYRPRDWAGPMYLAMLANTGVIDCYGTPPFEERGAIAKRSREYRGEAYVDPSDSGHAEVIAWSPNHARIRVENAPGPKARLVYNMNFDAGWSATIEDGITSTPARVEPDQHRVSVSVPQGESFVELHYRPPGLRWGVFVFVLTLGAAAAWVLFGDRVASKLGRRAKPADDEEEEA